MSAVGLVFASFIQESATGEELHGITWKAAGRASGQVTRGIIRRQSLKHLSRSGKAVESWFKLQGLEGDSGDREWYSNGGVSWLILGSLGL